LKERLDPDSGIVRERARNEIRRTAQLELLEPLGYESTPILVVKESDAERAKVRTLSETGNSNFRWKLGVSYDFQQRPDGLPALSAYKIPMEEETRAMDAAQLFPSLEQGKLSMIAVSATDGHLPSPQFAVLDDDKGVFPIYQASLLVRQDALAAEPNLLRALSELSGKFSTAAVRKLTAALELDHREPSKVAAGFLAEAGLK
jgi:osmoprotectant transport system substrate-binding protein